jgi:peptide/nickel transport system substrate-binding protein
MPVASSAFHLAARTQDEEDGVHRVLVGEVELLSPMVVGLGTRMVELPSGTVTFLFTDVEGSTRLLKQLRDRYGQVLAEHRRILRAAFEEHGGQEIDTQGDAFFVAFRKATDAALAAGAAQRALSEHAWPDGTELRVRMGIHTGEPAVGDEGYHGLGVHRAARIMAAGHGGQILLSQATCSVLEDDELPGIGTRDLGQHRLKDLDRPEHIFQLDIDGLPQEFPALRTEEAPTAYTGREAELERTARAAVWRARFGTRGWRAGAIVGFLVTGGLIAVLVLILVSSGTTDALSHVDADAVGLINPKTNKIAEQVPVGAAPSHLAAGKGAIWVTNAGGGTVSRIDSAKREVVQTISVGSGPTGIAVGNGAVWVADSLDGTVSRIDPDTNTVVQTIPVGNGPVGLAFGAHSIWVANTNDNTIARISADSGRILKTLKISGTEVAFGAGALWASDRAANGVSRINPTTGSLVQRIGVGNGPTGLAFGDGSVWVANTLDGTVSRIDPARNSVTATIPVGDGPSDVAVGAGGVWVSNEFDGTVARIDPERSVVVQRIGVGNRPTGVSVANGSVLVSVLGSGAGHRGGTLALTTSYIDSIDTAVAYDTRSWSILNVTGDGLTGFVRAGGSEGTRLVPDLAVSLPAPSDDGRTYAFQLRRNIRYSSGALVKPADIRYAIERLFKLGSAGVGFYEGIVGGAKCAKSPKRCDLSGGIVTSAAANTVAFHLTGPDPEFLYRLALPFAYAVPVGTLLKAPSSRPLPATGPYAIESYRPNHLLKLVRNRQFHEWSKAAQPDGYPDEIVLKIVGDEAAMVAVERGSADVSSLPPTAHGTELKRRYASQVHTNPQPTTIGFFLNTRVPPFDDVNVRRALNYAVDRAKAVGGSDAAQPTCQILPPNFPAYRRYCPYTVNPSASGSWTGPDLARARHLVAASGTQGMQVTVWSYTVWKQLGPVVARALRSLGYKVSVKLLGDSFSSAVNDSRNRAQIGFLYWAADYPAASSFFNTTLSCGAFRPNSDSNLNAAEFCDRSIDRQIKQALSLQATNPQAAGELWEQADKLTVDRAPWVPLLNPKSVDFLSKRVGNYRYSPQWGMLIDQLWVR